MGSQTVLLNVIRDTEARIIRERQKIRQHKLYFKSIKKSHQVMALSIILPVIWFSFSKARKTRFYPTLKTYAKVGVIRLLKKAWPI